MKTKSNGPLGGERRAAAPRASAEAQVHVIGKSGPGDIGARHLGMGMGLASSVITRPPERERAGKPDGAVAAERTNLEDGAGADGLGQQA